MVLDESAHLGGLSVVDRVLDMYDEEYLSASEDLTVYMRWLIYRMERAVCPGRFWLFCLALDLAAQLATQRGSARGP